jgi:chromosome segregation ATPase
MSRASETVAELEEELEDCQREIKELREAVDKAEEQLADSEEDYSALDDVHNRFVEYVETLLPGTWTAFRAIETIEGNTEKGKSP